MQRYKGEVYATDLIGCGTIGGDTWDPNVRGLFFPLSWVQQCETLIQTIRRPCAVICQGAIAPVGVVLASRDCERRTKKVSHLILASPPEYNDMIHPLPQKDLEWNYNFYRSPVTGGFAFGALENRSAIWLFSNLFLFDSPISINDSFVTNAAEECRNPKLRPPIMAFNAGLLLHRSLRDDLASIQQPTLILSGVADIRNNGRQGYKTGMKDCTLKTIRGKNILPWESSGEVCEELTDFILRRSQEK